jgi:hypothetical protein
MRSFALLRTNVALTTNVKVMVSSDYSLFLDSIVSTPELSDTRYKRVQFNKDDYFDDLLSRFYLNTPVDVAFRIKYDFDVDNMSTDFANQYDDTYQYGARNISENKFYSEEYEYFAPLHINKNQLPSNFIIFRLDGPGLIRLTKDNFRDEVVRKMKFVKNFDLTQSTILGQWINKNFVTNINYPNQSLYIDFRKFEFSSWKGIDYERGGYSERNFLLDSVFEYEQTYLDLEKLVIDGYKNNKVIYPNLVNFNFLFDDTPATSNSLRKWSLNRYLGFYFDELTLVKKLSPNNLPKLYTDVIIDDDNILFSPTQDTPFSELWRDESFPYVEIDNVYYKIEKFEQISNLTLQKIRNSQNTFEEKVSTISKIKYKVISEIPLSGKTFNDMNRNLVRIDNLNRLIDRDGNPIVINDFGSADLWLIQIGDKFHTIVNQNGFFTLITDYGFRQSDERFEYYINDPNPNFNTKIDLITKKDYPPVEFPLYKCKFTDIKDFDTNIVDTEYSKFEYIKKNELTDTDETKMFMVDLESTNSPKDFLEFKIKNEVTNIPTSSEYTANSETFRLVSDTLSVLWRKNSERVKWGFLGSISANDYPYLLNNSLLSEDYNRICDTSDTNLVREKRNLDHFYTINSNSGSYTYHSLHIEEHLGGILNTNFKFEVDKYLGLSYSGDYFSYLFGKKTYFENGVVVKKTHKYSTFQSGDEMTPNITLFRGVKFKISEVDNINISDNKIDKINLKNSNKFEDWKFSIIVSENDHIITTTEPNLNTPQIFRSENVLRWRVIDEWKLDKDYYFNSLVVYNNILYVSLTSSIITDPNDDPSTSIDWVEYQEPTIFYSSTFDGFTNSNNMSSFLVGYPPLVYNGGEFYYSDGTNAFDFWRSDSVYPFGEVVTYNNTNWQSIDNNNTSIPSETSGYFTASTFMNTWGETDQETRWKKVELWDRDKDYSLGSSWNSQLFAAGDYVLYDGIVYGTTFSPPIGVEPPLDPSWTRVYSMIPDTNFLYNSNISSNNIIFMNGKFYQCLSNNFPNSVEPNIFYNFTLDNGIYVFINEKYKNILINIYVNDNSYSDVVQNGGSWDISKCNLNDTNRDDIYTKIYSKLSTNNLINSLNDLSNSFGFSDKVKYLVIGEDSSVKIYDFNNLNSVTSLPYLISCEPPTGLFVRKRSNIYESIDLNPNEIKAKRELNDSNIDSLNQLNWYNGMHLASKITKNLKTTLLLPNYSGLTNDIYNVIYRHSGFYAPITKDIELFDSPSLTQSTTNYKFDTELTDFGILKQRIVSKVNRNGNLLKLRNNVNLKSVYPMLEEFGYHTIDTFIFKSTWDYEYHYETQEYVDTDDTISINTKNKDTSDVNFRNNNTKLL